MTVKGESPVILFKFVCEAQHEFEEKVAERILSSLSGKC